MVFAALFLGNPLPNIRSIWKKAGPMIAHGQTLAWGQYVVGLLLAVFLIVPIWDGSPLAGALIEIGFEGGHGTAAGLGETFRELGFADGADMALGLATIGVVAASTTGLAGAAEARPPLSLGHDWRCHCPTTLGAAELCLDD